MDPMSTEARSHEWFASRLKDHAAGLASKTESRAIEAHLESCSICRDRLVMAERAVTAPLAAHLPGLLIVRWERTQRELKGLERELARRHLKRCESCRREIRDRGFNPDLDVVPELEPPSEVLKLLVRTIEPAPRDWTRWFLIPYSALATATLLALLFGGPSLLGRHSPSQPKPFSIESPSVSEGAWTLTRVEPLRVRSSQRGASATIPVLEIAPDARQIPIWADPFVLPESTVVEVAILNEGGDVLTRKTVKYSDLLSAEVMLSRPHAVPDSGSYILRLRSVPTPGMAHHESQEALQRFRLRAGQ
jgi:hypothetical protein